MAVSREPSTPPPVIGKIGPYTVFMTPPSTPKPADPVFDSPITKKVISPPPVQPPPHQFQTPTPAPPPVSGFFKNAVLKVQNAHSSLDDHLARWFGLNQSKYQWALDDYYQTKAFVFLEKKLLCFTNSSALCKRNALGIKDFIWEKRKIRKRKKYQVKYRQCSSVGLKSLTDA